MSGRLGHLGLLLRAAPGGVSGDLSDVQALFAGGATGGLYDCTDAGTLWADAAMTTPASVNGVVRGITDLSGNGMHLTNTATTFLLKNDGTRNYLECPGTAFLQAFTSANATLGSAAGYAFAACYRATDYSGYMTVLAADRSLAYVSPGISTLSGADAGSISTTFRKPPSSVWSVDETGSKTAGLDVVASFRVNSSGGILRRDGAQTASASGVGVGASVASSPLSLAAGFANASNNYFYPFKGRIYCAMFVSSPPSDIGLQTIEAFFSARAVL